MNEKQHEDRAGVSSVNMAPIAFDLCYGWLHSAAGAPSCDVAIVLCPGLSRDGLDSYYWLRCLADELAGAGYPTLRFAYPGTADSRDADGGDPWADWLGSVGKAIDWLRQSTGASRIVLCGLRIGAALAAVASRGRQDVAGLMLLAPVIRGRTYMRQLAMESRLLGAGAEAPEPGGLDHDEIRLGRAALARIEAVDLRELGSPGCAVLVLAQGKSAQLDDCLRVWRAGGHAVTEEDFAALAPLLRRDLDARAWQAADFSGLTAWLRQTVPPVAGAQPGAPPPPPVLRHLGCVERPLRFGTQGHLFGMLCAPPEQANAEPLAVLVVNVGRDPHYGIARYGVEFARDLAAAGIASLRMDFAGLGDSLGSDGGAPAESHVFETSRAGDIAAALDTLEALGYRRFAVQGICAGAYHAFHAARSDRRIEALLLVNLPFFTWDAGRTILFSIRKAYPPLHYLRKLTERRIWTRLLRREIDLPAILAAQRARLRERLVSTAGRVTGGAFARRAMGELARRNVRVLLLMGQDDPGIDAIAQEFGPTGAGLGSFAGVTYIVSSEMDHNLSRRGMRRFATGRMIDFLRNRTEQIP